MKAATNNRPAPGAAEQVRRWSAPPLLALARWAPRLLALIVATTLGLLSPLSCVVHCAIHGRPLGAAQALAHAAGHQHHVEHPAAPGHDEPAAPPAPRALYELASLAVALLIGAGLLARGLRVPPPPALTPVSLAPPSPPPRPLAV